MSITRFSDTNPKQPRPLNSETFADFHEKPVPKIDWLIPGILVRGGATLFSGQGGKGKSLLCMQLQAALALGQDWLGMPVKEPMPSLGIYCEDERDILHQRMEDIRKFYGCSFTALEQARFKSRVGWSNELMTFWDRKQEGGKVTPFYQQLQEDIAGWGIKVLIIDTVADAFGGNENIRSQARSFVNALRMMVLPHGGGIVLNAHPSRAGLTDGSGLSGSTAWEASVRARVNLTEPKKPDEDAEGEQEPTRERILKVMKNNYGPSGTKWKLRWESGVFVRVDTDAISLNDRLEAKAALIACARDLVARGALLSPEPNARTSLVAKARDSGCGKYSWGTLRAAQRALEEDKQLVIVEIGPSYRRRRYIRPQELRLPGEPL